MNTKNPPAFPVSWQDGDGQMVADPGMTLRDYFAAHAMAAYISAGNDTATNQPSKVAAWAYENADAMLAEREGK